MMFNFGRRSMLRNNIDNSDNVKNAAMKCGVVWHKVFLYTCVPGRPPLQKNVAKNSTRFISIRKY